MTCRACRGDRLEPVFEMEPMPLAGTFPATRDEALAATRYPLTWLLCHDCGLVNVEPDIPDELIYATYSYAASTVPALVRHHTEFAAVLTERYGNRPINLLEIGGNDGVLLNQLPDEWWLLNIDPSDVAERASKGARWRWHRTMPGVSFPSFDVITSSNAMAHFSDIGGMLDQAATVLGPGGEFWIEVHDLDATLASCQWDTIYHEHKVEWSLSALIVNAAARGLELRASWRLPLHGGLLRVLFAKAFGGPRVHFDRHTTEDFANLRAAYLTREAPRLPVAAWAYGAAARATVYLNQVRPDIEAVVDGSPLRQGRYIPGTGTPIVPPSQFGDPPATLITAWSQADDIKAKHPAYDRWVTAW